MTKHDLNYAREVWRAAMTLANNLAVQVSDDMNSRDETEGADAASRCANRFREYLSPDDDALMEMLDEAGVKPPRSQPLPDSIVEALNSGDGVYRP